MPTVVDSLVVELELDPKKFESGRKQAEDAFEKTKLKALQTGKSVEESAAKAAEGIGVLKNGVFALFAAFTGIGVVSFMKNMVHADAATGRTAKTIDMTTRALSEWEGVAELGGAKTGELTAGFVSLTQALKTAELTGDASLGAKFRQLFGIDVVGEDNKLKTAAELYLEIAKKAEGMDPAKAATAMNILGVPAGVIPTLLKGGDELQRLLKTMRDIGGATDEDAAKAVQFENAWTRALKRIQAAARETYPALSKMLDEVSLGLSPKSIALWKKGLEVTKSWFTDKPSEYYRKRGEYMLMEEDLKKWESSEKAKEYLGQGGGTSDPLRTVGQGESPASLPPGGAFKSQAEKEAFIRAEAIRLKVDPDQAMRIAKSEGFYNFRSTVRQANGQQEPSFGAFQLYTGGGLGNVFKKQTGLDPSDPANERATISFALQHAATSGNGWKDWHGWKGAQFEGLPSPGAGLTGGGQGGARTNVTIGTIQVNTQAKDADDIAHDIGPAIRRDMMTQQSNNGPE